MLKRIFDIMFSIIGILFLFPFFLLISFIQITSSGWPIFYLQTRVGLHGKDFKLFKFRTMTLNADQQGLLTVGGRDPRVTKFGYFLRKYKLDEFPQLFNVVIGNMSLVGPRPEVRKYIDLYDSSQLAVLSVKPGITDYASLEFINENELLATSIDAEHTYIHEIMPKKLKLNLEYIQDKNLILDLKIILKTLLKIVK